MNGISVTEASSARILSIEEGAVLLRMRRWRERPSVCRRDCFLRLCRGQLPGL